MSKITKEHLIDALVEGHERSRSPHPMTYEQNTAVVLQELIDQREAELQALVDAAVAWKKWYGSDVSPIHQLSMLHEAIEPFLPPTDQHKELADEIINWINVYGKGPIDKYDKLREIAAEIEKLGEGDGL